jgi:hypothetical protein
VKRLGRRGRFRVACLVTIVVVTYLFVPWIVDLIEAGRGYNPFYYEPKDLSREEFIVRHGLPASRLSPWQVVVNVVLVVGVAVVWLTLLPRRR